MQKGRTTGINAALVSAFFLGLAPVFGGITHQPGSIITPTAHGIGETPFPVHLPGGAARLSDRWKREWGRIPFLLCWIK